MREWIRGEVPNPKRNHEEGEEEGEGAKRARLSVLELSQVLDLTSEWIQEIEDCMIDSEEPGEWEEIGWDDVKYIQLPVHLGAGRIEEVGFMEGLDMEC